jgi:Uma2 family endonuclease
MAAIPKLAPSRMTVEEFLDWPGDGSAHKFQLIDGEPMAMAPASVRHGTIQANVAQANVAGLFRNHLVGTSCYVVITPGIIPRIRSEANFRIPDLAVSCERDDHGLRALAEAKLIVDILSPSNEAETRESVWAYATIPTVREILLIRLTRIAAELLRRQDDATWPANPEILGTVGMLRLESIEFSCPLSALFEGTHLVQDTRGV